MAIEWRGDLDPIGDCVDASPLGSCCRLRTSSFTAAMTAAVAACYSAVCTISALATLILLAWRLFALRPISQGAPAEVIAAACVHRHDVLTVDGSWGRASGGWANGGGGRSGDGEG